MNVNYPCKNIRRRIGVVYPYESLFLTLGCSSPLMRAGDAKAGFQSTQRDYPSPMMQRPAQQHRPANNTSIRCHFHVMGFLFGLAPQGPRRLLADISMCMQVDAHRLVGDRNSCLLAQVLDAPVIICLLSSMFCSSF
jgi:hypothetical protein